MAKILTGIQSTGTPHLGNILGAIIPAIDMANSSNEESYLFIANMHSLTQIKDKETLRKFSHIIMEYHNGYLKLEEQLKKYGFHVKTKFVKREDKRGFLYATRE